jgi:hypothetical protein
MASKSRPTETIELDYSIEIDGVSVETLTMRRPTVRDQMVIDKAKGSDTEKAVKFFANLCEVAPSSIEALDTVDFTKLSEVLQDFQAPQSET